ncbi:MAG: aminotransferase class I/II-fold pyridoxal phosphate-dependent enzyme [Candidatus Aminicenantes bacterium]|nr:aminotransferase class I/II-fold pyridoxal phosphate-dependent enzyme [Candidatus Aminicenantes bacterium]
MYPEVNVITGPSCQPRITINGKEYLTFASNNYLGLAKNDELIQTTISNLQKYGIGSGSTRVLSGTLDIQTELEKKLTDFFGYEGSITFPSGFLANIGVIRMLVDPFPYTKLLSHGQEGLIISDELNHASVIDGIRLSNAARIIYKHNDMNELCYILEKNRRKRKLIVTDSVFSMDGDIADLHAITKLAKEHDTLVFLDDSHGVGVLGPFGEGAAHHLGIKDGIHVLMGSFTKSFGSIGGYIACSKEIEEYLRLTARPYIFSDPIIPSLVASLIKTVDIVHDCDDRRQTVINGAAHLRAELTALGFRVLGDTVPIVPIMIGDEKKVIQFSNEMMKIGILAPAIRRPAVIEGKERLRLSLMATHKRDDIDFLIEGCKKIGKKIGII